MSFIEKMWKEQRVLSIIVGVVLFPIAIVLIGLKIYMALQVNAAHRVVENAKKTDKELAAEEDLLKQKADQHLRDANKAAERIENRNEEGATDMDWHKKRKD